MACRPARRHGPHDPGERGAFPEGDGEGVQDRIAGIYLRDGGVGWRKRGPEEPAERVDEARGSTRATLPCQNRPQGDDLSRALRPSTDPCSCWIRPALAALPARNTCIL